MHKEDAVILYSGGRDSIALYALSVAGNFQKIPRPGHVHMLHMLNGMGRFPGFPEQRLKIAEDILKARIPDMSTFPATSYVELDCGRLFQGLWLDHCEDLMPKFGGKNLVCVACKLAMHTRAIAYCVQNFVPVILAGYAKRQSFYPEQTKTFMNRIEEFSAGFGITSRFPIYEEFDSEHVVRHLLEDYGLPSTGGGERKCLFCQVKTTATEKETADYLDHMIPKVTQYLEYFLEGRPREAAGVFPPGSSVL